MTPSKLEGWEDAFRNQYGLGGLYTKHEAYLPNPYEDVLEQVIAHFRDLLEKQAKEMQAQHKDDIRALREVIEKHDNP